MVGVDDAIDRELLNPHVLFDQLGASPSSAAAGYRLRHVGALATAYNAGKSNKPIDAALVEEAFGGHYLTDSFSAGHVRTARTNIKETWSARAPMFWFNLQGYIGQAIAEELATGGMVPPSIYYDGVDISGPTGGGIKVTGAAETIRAKFADQAPISFGDLVSGILHDKDNDHGIDVTSDGLKATLKGDGHMGEADEKKLAVKAVQAGVREVEAMHAAGAARAPGRDAAHRLLVDGHFAAERMMPHALPDAQQSSCHKQAPWQAATAEMLLQRSDFQSAAFTFMQGKAATMRESIADMSETNRQVFETAVLRPLVASPGSMAKTLQAVLDWVPNPRAIRQTVMDEYTRDYFKVVKQTPGGLASLTIVQRKEIIDGLKNTDDINSVIKSAPAGQQAQLADYALQALQRGNGSDYRGM
jgi:hypothetical protein